MSRFLTATLLCLAAGTSAWTAAQESKSKQPTSFEVASIKPIQPVPPYANFFVEFNRLRGNHVTTAMVVERAYGVHRSQLIGGPAWIDTDRFNIDARAGIMLPARTESGDLQEPLAGMVRSLLADRFQLRVRRETREMPVLALTHARQDRRTRDRIRPAKVDCTSLGAQLAVATDDVKKTLFSDCFETAVTTTLVVRGKPIARLAERIGAQLDRIVIDGTGLTGILDIDVEWEFDREAAKRKAMMLVAIEEQLGLKLESRRVPMPVLVIERISRPSPN